MDYNSVSTLIAWQKFINKGVLDEGHIRPEIARSWARCRDYNLDPWSTAFDKTDEDELNARRAKYGRLVEAAGAVLQYLTTMFNCNASLSDCSGFVFELVTPLSVYSRTLGTFVLERHAGTGNLPLALVEKKPVRVDGFEHYRAVSQNYSGVSVPITVPALKMDAILSINNPFVPLPKEALEVATAAGELIVKLCGSRQEVFSHLSSGAFFNGIIQLKKHAIVVVDQDGMILNTNSAGKQIVTEYESYPYSGQFFGEYLKEKSELSFLLNEPSVDGNGRKISFAPTKSRKAMSLTMLRNKSVVLQNGVTHSILIFEHPDAEVKEAPAFIHRQIDTKVDYIGQSAVWKKVDDMVRKVAAYKSNVLLLGATGTGKEVVARAIHRLSGRSGEFVAINCGAVPRDLLASELFGYVGGAFTGAQASGAMGKFEYADGGTLFLDEIGEISPDMQVALLRVLQEQVVTRIGSNKQKHFDVRVISATNQDIEELIIKKRFRPDLRYRLSVIEIKLPLLKDRKEDIPLLAQYFNATLGTSLRIAHHPLSEEVLQNLARYDWPGNVRELKNAMERALVMADGQQITLEEFEWAKPKQEALEEENVEILTKKQRKELSDKKRIMALVEKNNGNLSLVARELNCSRNTLYRKLRKYGIQIKVRAFPEED